MISRFPFRFVSFSLLAAITFGGSTHSIDFTEPTNFSRDLVFPGHDSADGPLRGVALCLRWRHARDVVCESLDAQSSVVQSAYTTAVIDVSLSGSSLATLSFAPFQRLDTLTAFDGVFDFQGTSAFQTKTSTHGNQLIVIDDPAIVAAFIDVPSVTINVRGVDIFSLSGPGNLYSRSMTEFQLQGMLIYGGV